MLLKKIQIKEMDNSNGTAMPFECCFAKTTLDGKPGTTVLDHCRYSGFVAKALLDVAHEKIKQMLPLSTPFFVALHDIGKVSPGYQGKYFLTEMCKYSPDSVKKFERGTCDPLHTSVGGKYIYNKNNKKQTILSNAIASHHGLKNDIFNLYNDGQHWNIERDRLYEKLEKLFDRDYYAKSACIDSSNKAQEELLTGIMCLSDWIASDEEFFPSNEKPLDDKTAEERAYKAVFDCGFKRHEINKNLTFKDVFGYNPYDVQSKFIESIKGTGVYILEAPMGMGKTEAALYAAYKLISQGYNHGLYFALPTRLTSDKIYERVEGFLNRVLLERTPLKLAHGKAWLKEYEYFLVGSINDEQLSNRVPPWFNPSKRGLLYPYAVGTIDQTLLGVLNVKHNFLRLFGLAGKVIILDEVHSYDTYTGSLLDELIFQLKSIGCTIIILSATLTTKRRGTLLGSNELDSIIDYPLITGSITDKNYFYCASERPEPRKVKISWLFEGEDIIDDNPVISKAIEKARQGCNVLCIANTVAEAQNWFKELKSSLINEIDKYPIGLLHSRFIANDRDLIEKEWLGKLGKSSVSRPNGSILISTQIVEQSVDIDVDFIISAIAPIDMLIQRLGRLWRHYRENRPIDSPEILIVLKSKFNKEINSKNLEKFLGGGRWVYSPYVLLNTFKVLQEREYIFIPDEIRDVISSVYDKMLDTDDALMTELFDEQEKEIKKLHGAANAAMSKGLPTREDSEVSTRYGNIQSRQLLLVEEIDGNKIMLLTGEKVNLSFDKNINTLRKIYNSMVSISEKRLYKMYPDFSIDKSKTLLDKYFYVDEIPLICCIDKISHSLKPLDADINIGLYYDSWKGLYVNDEEKIKFDISKENEISFQIDGDW